MKRYILICLAATICAISFAKEPKHPDTYNYQRGIELVENGDYDEGIKFLEKNLNQNPKCGYTQAWLATAYVNKGERGTAIHFLEEAQKNLPKADKHYHAWAYSLRGAIYLEMKDTMNALSCYTSAIKTQPNNEGWYESRGCLYRDLKRWKESDADFEKYIKLTPGRIIGYLHLADNLYQQERYEEALSKYQYTHQLAERSYTYSGMAKCEVKVGKYEDAVEHVIKAFEMEPYEDTAVDVIADCNDDEFVDLLNTQLRAQILKNPNAIHWYMYQILLYRKGKKYEDAIIVAKKVRKITPDPYLDNLISDLYSDLGDFNKALEYINLAIDADSTDNDYVNSRAAIYWELGNSQAMMADYATLLERDPEDANYYGARAIVYFFLGEYQKALDDYDILLALAKDYDWARYMRARCLQNMGDTAKANKEFRRVLDKTSDSDTRLFAMASLNLKEPTMHFADSLLKADSSQYRYNIACVYALLGEKELALTELEKVLQEGWTRFVHLSQDPDLQLLQEEELHALIEKYRAIRQERITRFNEELGEEVGEERVVEIPFTAANGVTKVDCTINGLPLNFVFDTGASDVTISQTEANFMYKNGYLSEKDVVGKQRYLTADGSVHIGTVFMINKINFGGLELTGVQASVVGNQKAPLLLGQTVLKRLGKIEIDNERRILRITTK